MARENALQNGLRYLGAGRLCVEQVDDQVVAARCRGDRGEVYRLGYQRGGWHCSCPALGDCAHLFALWSVTVRPGSSAS